MIIKKNLLLLFFIFSSPVYTQINKADSASLDFIRHKFYEGVEKEEEVDRLDFYLREKYGNDFNSIDPIIIAYFGAIEALRGKHAFFPFTKLSYVSSSNDILTRAIEKDPLNLEIRFIRFSILHHVPGILGYGNECEEDMEVIYRLLMKKDYSQVNAQIQKGIAEFMIDSDRLSEKQTDELRKLAEAFVLK